MNAGAESCRVWFSLGKQAVVVFKFFDFMSIDLERMSQLYAGRPVILRQAIRLTRLSRVFIAILILNCALFLFSGSLILDFRSKLFSLSFLLATILLLAWACHLFETGRERRGRFMIAFATSISCILAVIFCGGFLYGRFAAILLFPMVASFALLPLRVAVWWFAAILLVPLSVDVVARLYGIVIPDFTSPADPWVHRLIIMTVLAVSVFFCLLNMKAVQHRIRGQQAD